MKRNMFWCKILKLLRSIFLYMDNTLWRGVTKHILVKEKEKAQRKIEIWLYMVWSWPNLVSCLNWVKRDEKSHFSVKGGKTSWSCWRFVRFVPKLPKKISWSVAQIITQAVILLPLSHYLCRVYFFSTNRDKSENLLQSLGAMRGLRVCAR